MRSASLAKRGGQDLDGDVAIQLGVARAVDLAHAARAQGSDDFVWAEFIARRKLHVNESAKFTPFMQWIDPELLRNRKSGRAVNLAV